MANVFEGSEVVELAIQIEKNGKEFYDILTAKSKIEKAKDVFKFLSGEEEKHVVIFTKILENVHRYEPQESYPGEYLAYMNTLAADYVFTRKNTGREIAKKIKSDKEAVDVGIGHEKDSILFYEGMKKVVPEDEAKVVEEVILQEQSHLKQLMDLKKIM